MRASAYTREHLEDAARGARTLTEALVRLGVDPKSSTRRYVSERMKRLGVDTSHFEREVKWTRDILQAAVSASTNMCEVLRHLGLDVVGGHHTHISRRIKAYGIDTSHFEVERRGGRPWRPRTPEGLLVEQPPAHARRIPSDRIKWAMTALGVPDGAPCAIPKASGGDARSLWKSTTSTATGGTTVSRTSGFSAPIAMQRQTPGAEAAGVGKWPPTGSMAAMRPWRN